MPAFELVAEDPGDCRIMAFPAVWVHRIPQSVPEDVPLPVLRGQLGPAVFMAAGSCVLGPIGCRSCTLAAAPRS